MVTGLLTTKSTPNGFFVGGFHHAAETGEHDDGQVGETVFDGRADLVAAHVGRRHRIRRYGFHGTSHRYVAFRYRALRGLTREQTNIITLHLGNGCSAAAIRGGSSVDTSMGMTPLEGLVMGTRSGDLDPAIVNVIARKEGMSPSEVDTLLNTQSGLLGISGLTNDMRELQAELKEHDDRRVRLAIEVFCYRARKYIGAYLAAHGWGRRGGVHRRHRREFARHPRADLRRHGMGWS